CARWEAASFDYW
nr:immunoglobulin heavy chain junction region [Macaca mulatta]MOX59089.1 immunoglobulin heavy chain junction region [Macaca mulatta]MOX61239.1 immunoglobulin heavy chain junction region [Macaca mulatta]MOX61299.1 immunoglobulin heavy chain junction region [Macaca mulatta]MOX62181.1 immunoglobulin heavy chain junction region [Macaca mulatta]